VKALRTYIELANEQDEALPEQFASDDVRYPSSLVRFLFTEFTQPGDIVFDPFAGWGTTLCTAEAMGRHGIGLEYDKERCAYARTRLREPDSLLCGDARQLATYNFPSINCSIT
jgi:DNA methylase